MRAQVGVVSLHIYPVKSCAGIELKEMSVGPRGPLFDREWMIVDENRRFLTQRQHAELALVACAISKETLTLTLPDRSVLRVPLAIDPARTVDDAVVWSDSCRVLDEGAEIAEALSGFLGRPARLVRLAPNFERRVNVKYGIDGAHTSLADSLPFLLTSEESLADLNSRLDKPVPMDRFRSNIVIRGAGAYSEDAWKRIRIGDVDFDVSKPCVRCVITTIDQSTAEKGREPLATLATYRKIERGIAFGQNMIHLGEGVIRVGDGLQIQMERRIEA